MSDSQRRLLRRLFYAAVAATRAGGLAQQLGRAAAGGDLVILAGDRGIRPRSSNVLRVVKVGG